MKLSIKLLSILFLKHFVIPSLLVFGSFTCKTENCTRFYFHSINTDNFPTITVVGLVEIEAEELWTIDDLKNDFTENHMAVENEIIDVVYTEKPYLIFKLSYKSKLPKNVDRTFMVAQHCDYREYTFLKSKTRSIPEETWNAPPIGFVQAASARIVSFQKGEDLVKYVYTKDDIEVKSNPDEESETLAHLNYGEKIQISREEYGEIYCYDDIYKNNFSGNWHQVTIDSLVGYISDIYLSFMPANKNNDNLDVFLEGNYGTPKPLCIDERGDSLVLYGDYIVYNSTQKNNGEGYLYFNGISEQDVLVIAKDLFYTQNMHVEDSQLSDYYKFSDLFDFVTYEVSNERVYNKGVYEYWDNMSCGILWNHNSDKDLKRLLSMAPDFIPYKQIRSSEFIEAHKGESIDIPNFVWDTLLHRSEDIRLSTDVSKVKILGKSSFSYTNEWLVLFEIITEWESEKWLVLLSDFKDDNSKVVIEGARPIESEVIKDATIFYQDGSCFTIHFKSDDEVTYKRYYDMNHYGFKKGYD